MSAVNLSPAQLRAAQHDAAEGELRAHPAPERCDCPGHDLFLALAAVAAAYAHEDLPPGGSCQSCGHREPGGDVAPGQLAAWGSLAIAAPGDPWAMSEDAAADGAVVSWGEALGTDEGPAFYLRPWDPA